MKKNTKKILLIAAIVAVGILVFMRTRKKNSGEGNDKKPWFPEGLTDEQINEFQRKYLVFIVDGRTYYAHKQGEYAGYAYSPHGNFVRRLKSDNSEVTRYFYPFYDERIAPKTVTYKGKRYKVVVSNIKPGILRQAGVMTGLDSSNLLFPELQQFVFSAM